jgi:hypothetical protein
VASSNGWTEPIKSDTTADVSGNRIPPTVVFVKVVNHVAHADCVKEGRLRFGSVRLYRGIERDQERGDPTEGAVRRGPGHTVQITFAGMVLTEVISYQIDLHDSLNRTFLFCLYTLDWTCAIRYGVFRMPRRLRQLGRFVVVVEPAMLLEAVEQAAKRDAVSIAWGPVEYVGADHAGEWGPFRKYDRYAHQAEFRIALYPEKDADPHTDHCWLDVGALDANVQKSDRVLRLYHPCPKCQRRGLTGTAAPERTRRKRLQKKLDRRNGAARYYQRCRKCGTKQKVFAAGGKWLMRPR